MKSFLCLCAFLCAFSTIQAQEVWSADIQVAAIDAQKMGNGFQCNVKIYSYNDDDARQAHVQIQLPLNVGIIKMPKGCSTSLTVPNVSGVGYVRCALGDIEVNGTRTITILTTKSPFGTTAAYSTFGAMVRPLREFSVSTSTRASRTSTM